MEDTKELLIGVVDYFYNEYIGGNENAYLDGEEYHPYTEEELIETIVDDIMNEPGYLNLEDSKYMVEAKHIRFLGKDMIKAIVTGRVVGRHLDEGKWEWEKKTGNDQLREQLYKICDETKTSRSGMDYLVNYYQENLGWSEKAALEYAILLFHNGTIQQIKLINKDGEEL